MYNRYFLTSLASISCCSPHMNLFAFFAVIIPSFLLQFHYEVCPMFSHGQSGGLWITHINDIFPCPPHGKHFPTDLGDEWHTDKASHLFSMTAIKFIPLSGALRLLIGQTAERAQKRQHKCRAETQMKAQTPSEPLQATPELPTKRDKPRHGSLRWPRSSGHREGGTLQVSLCPPLSGELFLN